MRFRIFLEMREKCAKTPLPEICKKQIQKIGRVGGTTQFGNFYLGQPLSLNYLGRTEGQPGGSGIPPRNRF